MIIVLKDADFSQSNIGKIKLPGQINQFTLDAIEASGNSSMSDAQIEALNDFFAAVGAFGEESQIWSKLDKVYLPMICNTLAKSCVNYVDNAVDATPDSTWLEMRNHGIGRIAGATKGTTCILDTSYVWNWADKCAFVFNAETMSTAGNVGVINYAGSKVGTQSVWQTLFLNVNSASIINDFAANNVPVVPIQYNLTSLSPSLKGVSVYGETGIILDTKGVTPTSSYTVNSNAIPLFDSEERNLHIASAPNGGITEGISAIGAIILGTHLTAEECLALGTAFDALWEAFNV